MSEISRSINWNAVRKTSTSTPVEDLVRLGYGARGVLWATIGLVSLQATLAGAGAFSSRMGALTVIDRQPAGQVVLALVLVGLLGYAVWGVIRGRLRTASQR